MGLGNAQTKRNQDLLSACEPIFHYVESYIIYNVDVRDILAH